MHHVAKTLANLFADVLPHTDDEARRSHLDDLAVIWHPVKGGMNRQPTFAKERLDIKGHLNVASIHSLVLKDDGIEFILFSSIHKIRLIRLIRRKTLRRKTLRRKN